MTPRQYAACIWSDPILQNEALELFEKAIAEEAETIARAIETSGWKNNPNVIVEWIRGRHPK